MLLTKKLSAGEGIQEKQAGGNVMNTTELRPGIYAVGVVDWNVRSFHGYTTDRGATYNAYLIIDEKIALIDTVKEPFAQELLERIREIVDPEKIDYLISNHVEMDHSGAIPAGNGKGRPMQ